jgi:pimeloyl-ACP methyl ester carboxylesterase
VELIAPERFTAVSADGVEVECWAMAPRGVAAGERAPTILNIHGGPFTSYGWFFFDEFQLQVSAGFGVIYCNPRGSSGYSEAWGRAIRWPEAETDPGSGWGGVDYNDVMACVDEACKRFDWIDDARLGVQGGSYGGYMTSWIVGHTDRFVAACSERAANNLLLLECSSDAAGSFRTEVGFTHLDRSEPYTRHSPSSYVADMHTPMLLIHSEDDLRCPISQAEELFVGCVCSGGTQSWSASQEKITSCRVQAVPPTGCNVLTSSSSGSPENFVSPPEAERCTALIQKCGASASSDDAAKAGSPTTAVRSPQMRTRALGLTRRRWLDNLCCGFRLPRCHPFV